MTACHLALAIVRNCPRVTETAKTRIDWRKWAINKRANSGWGMFLTKHQTRFL